jgi:adenylate cyclase
VAILYIVVSYLILEPFEMFFHLLDLPVWTGRTAVALMVLGFPVALLFAWIYEITPTGIKPSTDVDPQQSIARQTGRKLDRAIIAVLAVALIYFVADKFWLSKRVAVMTPAATLAPVAVSVPIVPVIPEKSVAVLPFVDMSEKKDQEYFSDGLSEELIDMLTKIPDLRVPARTSSFYFKGKQTTIADIAKMLSVTHVLEGSVRKSGNKLRVTAQLIRVDTGYHLWSQTFDRDAGDIFQIQDDISNAVVGALKVSLGALVAPHSDGTSNKDAYDLYLLAKSNYDGANSKEDFQKIVDQLNEAIRLDPSFGRAWAFLSGTLSTMGGFGLLDATIAFNDARSAALKGVALSPKEPDGHRALAKVLYLHDWDWERAESEMNQALSFAPEDPANLTAASVIASILGRANVAVRYSTRAVAKDPLSSVSWDQLGEDQMYAGNTAEAIAALRRAQELNPSYPNAHFNLGVALLLSGKPTEALAEFERDADDDDRTAGRALAYYSMRRTEEADAALRKTESAAETGGAFTTSQIHAYRGERDQAFAWLNRAYQRREPDCSILKVDPLLENLRTDPRFKAFLRKMKLPE